VLIQIKAKPHIQIHKTRGVCVVYDYYKENKNSKYITHLISTQLN